MGTVVFSVFRILRISSSNKKRTAERPFSPSVVAIAATKTPLCCDSRRTRTNVYGWRIAGESTDGMAKLCNPVIKRNLSRGAKKTVLDVPRVVGEIQEFFSQSERSSLNIARWFFSIRKRHRLQRSAAF